MKQQYIDRAFKPESLAMIGKVNSIIGEYQRAGYVLTVRQLYYQLVARDVIANNLSEYKKVASLLNDGRLAGLVDWDAIEDRTREFIKRAHWESPGQIVNACAQQFHMDLWKGQQVRPFVIVEKEALTGVLERVCKEYDVPLLAARGYPSVSVVREFVQEMVLPSMRNERQAIAILHLGDHDPSGIDMTRDLRERIELFAGRYAGGVILTRIALTMDQVEEQNPPENPAKATDSRFAAYRDQFGDSSWELDALTPQYLNELVEENIEPLIDKDIKAEVEHQIEEARSKLRDAAVRLDEEIEE